MKYKKVSLSTILVAILAAFSTGCTTTSGGIGSAMKETFASDDPCANSMRNTGIAVGVLAGSILELALREKGSKGNPVMGAALGGLVGGLIGRDIDTRRCELHKVALANDLKVEMTDLKVVPEGQAATDSKNVKLVTVGMSVAITDTGKQFATGSSSPTAEAIRAFSEVADKYKVAAAKNAPESDKAAMAERNKSIHILLVGHTDDTGSSKRNADLSEARAKEIARIFLDKGFSKDQIFFQGAGETLPIADNRTDEGRAKNRRVEIVDLADAAHFSSYLASRKPNYAFYRPVEPAAKPVVTGQLTKPVTMKPISGAKVSSKKSATKEAKAGGTIQAAPVATMLEMPAIRVSEAAKSSIDFGGDRVSGNRFTSMDIGEPVKSGFSLISSAQASDVPVGSCAMDRPRVSHGVKSMGGDTGQYSTSDYLPGAYGASWAGSANGHLVALTNVAVLRDGGAPARRPNLMIYRNFKEGDTTAKPVYKGAPEVNAYQGSKGLLYRVFVNGPVNCVDMLIPAGSPRIAPGSNLIYARNGEAYQSGFSPVLLK